MNGNGKPDLSMTLAALEQAVVSAPLAEIPGALGHVEKIKALGWGRMLAGSQSGQGAEALLTVPEVAKRLKVSEYRVYELVRRGEIKKTPLGEKKGSSVRVKPSDLAIYLAQKGA